MRCTFVSFWSLVTRKTNIQRIEYFLSDVPKSRCVQRNETSKLTITRRCACLLKIEIKITVAANSEWVADAMSEDQIDDIWPEHSCLYDVRTQDFKNKDVREKAYAEIVEKLGDY